MIMEMSYFIKICTVVSGLSIKQVVWKLPSEIPLWKGSTNIFLMSPKLTFLIYDTYKFFIFCGDSCCPFD